MMTFAVVALGMTVAMLALTVMAFAVACPSSGVIASHDPSFISQCWYMTYWYM
ncbi:hypothetical protein BFJ66_g6696 [Fusarium oxysporum f. sp. cepae]|nr:hypothetical protein BFJ66_g6696 [Fusarium oxysporum f. sp. cepae]